MKLDKEILEEKIRDYREFKSCSESTLMALCETANVDITQVEMVKLACGFAGGMGGTFDEGTCGAVTGALMANGILNDDPSLIKANAKESKIAISCNKLQILSELPNAPLIIEE